MCDTGPLHTCCSVYSVDGHPLPIVELKGIKPVDSIDLSGKGLNLASAVIIGACIKGNEHLRQLKYCNKIEPTCVTLGTIILMRPLEN